MRKFFFVCFLVVFALTTVFSMSVSAAEKNYASDKIFAISKIDNTTESVESFSDLGFDAVSLEVSENGITIDNLKKILTDTKDKIYVIVDCKEENLEEVFLTAKGYENVFLRVRDINAKSLTLWAKTGSKEINVIPSYNGNVIFSAISVYNSAEENSYEFCEFSSKNRYGVIFSDFFTSRFKGTKALMSFSEKDLSGQRNDSLHGWESVISLGYSAIETNNAREFSKYISLLNESYLHLEEVYSNAKETDISLYSKASTKNFEKQLKIAESILESERPSSQLEINECIEGIENSYSEFQLSEGEETNKTFSVTPMKIFWILFAIALFVSSHIYLHKKTKKS